MAENNDALMAYAMGQDNDRCNGNNGGWGDGWMGLITFAIPLCMLCGYILGENKRKSSETFRFQNFFWWRQQNSNL